MKPYLNISHDYYTIVRATLSCVIGPVLTEIHKSSFLGLFFFFLSDLAVSELGLSPQQPVELARRQQQQWQHTTREVKSTTIGRASSTTRQTLLKKSKMSSFMMLLI
uniref:Uncharacterized protein n=1 Tax=Oncorhynchus kisutch TaxID=8019 RepID=A0A8C7MVI5_ONCKI